jgi:transcriptional antiterminator Rof (Rho-off)
MMALVMNVDLAMANRRRVLLTLDDGEEVEGRVVKCSIVKTLPAKHAPGRSNLGIELEGDDRVFELEQLHGFTWAE